jgi:cytochrome P450
MPETITWKSGSSDAPLPPLMLPKPLPPALLAQVGHIAAFFLDSYQRMGPIFRFSRAGQDYTVIAGPEANQFIARESKNHFTAEEYRRDQNIELGIEKTLVSLNGEEHTQWRKLQTRGHSRSALNAHYPALIASTRQLASQWVHGPVIVRDVMPRLIAAQLGIGVLNYPIGDYFDDVLLFVRTVVTETVARIRPRSMLDSPVYLRAKARSLNLADQVIAAHRNGLTNGREADVVDDLLAALAENPDLMSEQELRITVLGGYIGGLDTVAYTCSFMLYALLKNPELLARVQAEVDAAFAEGIPAPPMLKNMENLHHAAMETLRLYSVSPAIQGTVSRPFEFAGYRVDEGQNLIIAAAVPHFLPQYFLDPFKFDVDRYADPRNEHRQTGVYAPFGLGEHICLGAGMAEVLIMLTMATILHTVNLTMEPADYQLNIELRPSPSPDANFRVRALPRTLQQ